MKVANKVIVVTGGGSGLGRAIVLNLLSKGARVAIVDINEAGMQETRTLAQANADKISIHTLSIADREAVATLPEQVIAHHGFIDGIINNAGIIQPFKRVNELTYDAIDRVIDINLYGTLYMSKAFLPHLLQRPEAHLVNVSSMGGFVPVPGQTIYGMTKAGVKLLTEGLHSELQGTSVAVTLVLPGGMETNITENSHVEMSIGKNSGTQKIQLMKPADAAALIVSGMEDNRARILVGKDARFMDWMYRLSPERAAHMIYKQMKNLLS